MSTHHVRLGDRQGQLRVALVTARGYRCERCGVRVTAAKRPSRWAKRAELHHVRPLSEGGRHTPDNCQVLCAGCHIRHHRRERINKLPPHVREWRQFMENSA